MLSSKDQLTELIRELEAKEHIFASDPLLVTEKMKNEKVGKKFTNLDKLRRRAERIDSNGKLTHTMYTIDTRINTIIFVMSIIWCVSGFMGLFALLHSDTVNFFYALVCILGVHTILLIFWILMAIVSHKDKPTIFALFVNPSRLIRGKDAVTTSAVDLYKKQILHSGMRWYLGKLTHQLWLATLTGMLISMLVLLAVKDFHFSWESTLLSADTVAMIVRALAFLPDLVGFVTPTTEQILQSQQFASQSVGQVSQNINQSTPLLDKDGVSSYEWAMLLISSLLMYGVLPRVLLWGLCTLMFHTKKMSIDLKLPYYQKIITFWSTEVVDKDDFNNNKKGKQANSAQKADGGGIINSIKGMYKGDKSPESTLPQATLSKGKKLVALLEYPYPDEKWYQTSIDTYVVTTSDGIIANTHDKITPYNNVEVFGILDGREDMSRMTDLLDGHEVQVLLGIHSTALPDRGTLRKIDTIAEHAKNGLVLQLLDEDGMQSEEEKKRLEQWQEALSSREIGLIF